MSRSNPVGLSEWVCASREARERALGACLEVSSSDREIHAWVQFRMRPGTDSGTLFGIPFGAKDIIETRGLITEYGSPIYHGRIGVEDADIISELQNRGAI